MPFTPPPDPLTFSSGIPANLSANVGQVGGTPLSPSDINNYLTQLGGSLNGFAGSLSNVLNYLLVQGIFTPTTVRVGILGSSFTPPYNNNTSTNSAMCGCAAGGVGSVFTPSSTGRVLVIGLLTATLNFPQATSVTSNIGGQMFLGKGTSGPAFGTLVSSTNGPTGSSTIAGAGFSVQWEQGTTGGTGFQQGGFSIGFRSGLTKNQSYWVDWSVLGSGTAASGGTILTPTFCLVVEV